MELGGADVARITTEYGPGDVVQQLGGGNEFGSAVVQSLPIRGAKLAPQPSELYGVDVPSIGNGPGETGGGAALCYTLTVDGGALSMSGLMDLDNSGWTQVLSPTAQTLTVPWTTPGQVMAAPDTVAIDTIVGGTGTTSFGVYPPINAAGSSSCTFELVVSARVLSTDGATETADDSYMSLQLCGLDYLNGASALMLPVGAELPFVQTFARSTTGTGISDMIVSVAPGFGGGLVVIVSNPIEIDASTVVLVQIHARKGEAI